MNSNSLAFSELREASHSAINLRTFCPLFPMTAASDVTTNHYARGEDRLVERTRIAQELHDTLLQGFIAASMQLHAMVDQLPADCATAKPRFSQVLQLLDHVIEQGRDVLQGLRSPDERFTSIGEAFAGLPNDLGFSSAVGFRVAVHGQERELRAGLCDEIYRIGCEAIINACRHARATEIEMEVEYRPTELRIIVRDNGCGIAPQVLERGRDRHWGLRGMRERAERIGARLRLSSKVALGTEVELRVPGLIAFQQAAAH
jgi:signal transduction histidine kinase